MTPKSVLPILLICLQLFACNNKPKEVAVETSDLIAVTKAQFESEKMALGEPVMAPFSELVHFTGAIVPSTNGWAQISLPIPGVINRIFCQPGQMVAKGSLLFEVGGNELIDMQRAFAESAAAIVRLKSEYERVKVLASDHIGSQKEYILAESSYLSERARYNSLKIKLENVGLDTSKIEADIFYTSYSLQSPINGSVTRINANIGQYIESQQHIAEIIDTQSFILKLSVFEKDISKINKDQLVEFMLAGNRNVKYRSRLVSSGKTIHPESKSVDCYAEIEKLGDYRFVSNQYAEGDIFVSTDSVQAVPETAVITTAGKSYVFLFEKEAGEQFFFRKNEVTIGRNSNQLTEIKEALPPGKIMVKGTYNLQIE